MLMLLVSVSMVARAQETVQLNEEPASPEPGSGLSTPATQEPESRSFAFYPTETGFGTYFNEIVNAGESVTLKATIANTGNVEQDLRTYSVDAFTAEGGGFASAEYGTQENEVTGWIEYSEEVFTIEVGTGIERTFSVAVPDGTAPGQYLAAIAAQNAESTEVEGSGNFRQIIRFVVPVFITVPGDTTTSFEIGDVSITTTNDAYVLSVVIQNTGDIRVRPEGEVRLLDSSGALLASLPVAMDSVYARESTVLKVSAPASVGTGPFGVDVLLADPESSAVASGQARDLMAEQPLDEVVQTPISIMSGSVAPSPSLDNVQFANVEATISNNGEPVTNAQLSLIARVDGEEVERFTVVQSLSLPTGDTPISTRYIPATGWTSGTWTFELLLETVEPGTASIVVDRLVLPDAIEVP